MINQSKTTTPPLLNTIKNEIIRSTYIYILAQPPLDLKQPSWITFRRS